MKESIFILLLMILYFYFNKSFYFKNTLEKNILLSINIINLIIFIVSFKIKISYLFFIPSFILLSSITLKNKKTYILNLLFIFLFIKQNINLFYLYLFILIFIEFINYLNYKSYKYIIKIIMYLILICSLFNNIYLGFTISIMIYYFYLFGDYSLRDELTNTLNRKEYVKDLNNKNITAIINIDLNNLKKINDTYGHNEGDKAIIELVRSIHFNIDEKMKLYRIGGDEFAILCYDKYKSEIKECIEKIKEYLLKTKYSCSIGVAYKENNISIKEMISLADEMMYKDKMTYKGEKHEEDFNC